MYIESFVQNWHHCFMPTGLSFQLMKVNIPNVFATRVDLVSDMTLPVTYLYKGITTSVNVVAAMALNPDDIELKLKKKLYLLCYVLVFSSWHGCGHRSFYLSEALKTQAIKRPGTPGKSPRSSRTISGTIWKIRNKTKITRRFTHICITPNWKRAVGHINNLRSVKPDPSFLFFQLRADHNHDILRTSPIQSTQIRTRVKQTWERSDILI